MRSSGRALVALVLLLPLLSGCLSQSDGPKEDDPEARASETTGAIEGRVVTDEWLPIQGAEVNILEATRTVKTSQAGGFAVSDLAPGKYTLVALKIGYFQKTVRIDVLAAKVTEVEIPLDRVPVADPPFDDVSKFWGNLSVGTGIGGEEGGPAGEPVDTMDFVLTIPEAKEDGTQLAAVFTKIELVPLGPTAEANDLDLYFLDPAGKGLSSSTGAQGHELIEHEKLLKPGDHIIRVYFWAGAASEFEITATVTYEQGEAAAYAFKNSK